MTKSHDEMKLLDMLAALENSASGPKISIGDLIDTLESRGFGPLLLLPGLLTFLPTGAIPGMPLICAIFISLVGGQILMGIDKVKLPKIIRNLSVSKSKMRESLDKARPNLEKIDDMIRPRMQKIFIPLVTKIIAAACIILGLLMIPLSAVPFAIMVPSAAIIMLALGLSARDGLLVLIGGGTFVITFVFVSVLVLG